MASKMKHSDIVKRIKETGAILKREEEEKVKSYMDDMDARIGEAINRASSMPVVYMYWNRLDNDPLREIAWERLANKYDQVFGRDKCIMEFVKQKVEEDLGHGDSAERTYTYGQFTLKE